jgi:mycothiol synthase
VTITAVKIATTADASAVANLINSHELSVDPANSSMGIEGALEFMAGYIDESQTHLLWIDGEPDFSAIVNLHPDAQRKRYFADIYAVPHVRDLDEITAWAVELAESQNKDWEIWPGVNSLDDRLQGAWAAMGFVFLRRYYTMRMQVSELKEIPQLDAVEIHAADLSDATLLHAWYQSHQDSFSRHFGFIPRTFEKWQELALEGNLIDPDGVFLAFMNGEVIGFCQCTDEYAHDRKGFISLLGVNQRYQGLGIGEALLRRAIAHYVDKKYEVVELNVDTGNESGALRLYEKLGFKAESSWIQMHRPANK